MGFYGAMGDQYTLVVNTDHKLVNTILENEQKEMSARDVYKRQGKKQRGCIHPAHAEGIEIVSEFVIRS